MRSKNKLYLMYYTVLGIYLFFPFKQYGTNNIYFHCIQKVVEV